MTRKHSSVVAVPPPPDHLAETMHRDAVRILAIPATH